MTWEKHRKILMKDPEVRKAWEETKLEREISLALIRARIEKRLTQAELAKKLQTRQSVISRVESGQTTPSLSLLKRLATALKVSLSVQFK